MDKAKMGLLLDILERVNRDPELVTDIRDNSRLEHPDLHVALILARSLSHELEGPPPSSLDS
jgi:hypothetical protein